MERIESGVSPVEEYIPLGVEDLKTQFIARTLGDGKGLDRVEYEQVFHSDIGEDFVGIMERLTTADLIREAGQHILMTDTGRLLYDLVMLSFYPEHAKAWLRDRLEGYQLVDVLP